MCTATNSSEECAGGMKTAWLETEEKLRVICIEAWFRGKRRNEINEQVRDGK